jgi:hypothetical protein
MKMKPLGTKVGIAGLALALVGCSGAGSADSEAQGVTPAEAMTPADLAEISSHSTIIHATVSIGDDHEVQFVEFQPGIFGLVEMGRAMIDVPMVTPEVSRLTWAEQYRHFAGTSAPLPQEMESALARASLAPASLLSEPLTEPPVSAPGAGDGPHFYTAGQQTWFNQTFCNGAQLCAQGFNLTNMQTPHKISRYSTFAMIGSEGPSNGTFNTFYWHCGGGGLFPVICKWILLSSAVVVPGHFINSTLSQQSSSWFFLWQLKSGNANTLVSSSASF